MAEEENVQDKEPENIEQDAKSDTCETEQLQTVTDLEPAKSLNEEKVEVAETGDEQQQNNEGDNEQTEGDEEIQENEGITEDEGMGEDEELAEDDLELNAAELEALFNKNTSSFRCLAQILLSRSSLLRHPLYHFPPLEDPGIDAAFNYVEPEEPIDNVCIERYKQLCKEMNIVPLSRVIKSLPTKQLNLRYYCLTDKEIKAVAIALKLNTFVEELNLEENFLYPESAVYIEELLRENNTLKVLNMRECRIGPEGAETLSEGIMLTQSLEELDLSFNDLGTAGLKALTSAFKENTTIKKLNLSHNNFSLDAAYHLASILKENLVLEDLDLSWNNFGTPQAMKVLFNDGIAVNDLIRSLNLAWNGITLKTAVRPLTKYIKKSQRLEILDLNNNRIGGVTLNMIKNAVKKSATLRGLNLAFNVLTPENAQVMADVFTSKACNLEVLDMENVFVKKDFLTTLKKANRMDKILKITGVLGNWKIKGPNVAKLLFTRARLLAMKPKRKKKKKDFSHFVLALPDKPMKKAAFEAIVKKFKMKMVDNDLMAEVIKLFPFKKKGIDCTAMKEKYMELFPDAKPAPPKKKKRGKGKRKKKKKKGADDGPSKTTVTMSSQFTLTTTAGSTIGTALADKTKASTSDLSQPLSTGESERSKTALENRQLSFADKAAIVDTTPAVNEDEKERSGSITEEARRTSVQFDGRSDVVDEAEETTPHADDRHHLEDGTKKFDSRVAIRKPGSQDTMTFSVASDRTSLRSGAFTIAMEGDMAKTNQEPLPTIAETAEIPPSEEG